MEKFMSNIYASKRVTEELPPAVIMLIISLVKNLHKEIDEVDYLQVIKIRNNILIHKQEVPKYRKAHKLPVKMPRCKLFFIDSGEYCTLIFQDEY